MHRPLGPRAFDCAQMAVVRAGSAILFGKFGDHYLNIGDVALISPCTLFRVEPEPWVTITTLYVDNDYLVDQIFWQYAAHFTDRLDTQTFLDAQDTDPIHVVRLGENRASLLTPWLDELTALSTNGLLPERFYRLQALLFCIFDIVVQRSTMEVSCLVAGQVCCRVCHGAARSHQCRKKRAWLLECFATGSPRSGR